MKKMSIVLGRAFVFISLWLSMFVILSRVRLLGLTQTPGGLGIYTNGSDEGAMRGDAIGAFFLAVVVAYAFWVLKRQDSR